MALSTQPYKGARDFYPEEKRIQKYVFSQLRHTVEQFGYQEYDAPILEPLELYRAKTGSEIVNEQTYTFTDRGGREVALRPEMTPTVSRMVAGKRQELQYPLRWYSIPNLWRYERPQRGRLREHWQLNVDIFGVASTAADFEIISLVDAILKGFGAKKDMYQIKLNSRMFLNDVLNKYLGLDPVQSYSLSKLIDRMHKIDRADFMVEADALCTPSQREQGVVEKLLDVLNATRMTSLPQPLQTNPALGRITTLLEKLQAAGISNVSFDTTLMRGFDYYTDIVFEVEDTHPDNNRSMFGGGRYDGLVGLFGVEPVPTVGFGMGDVTLTNFLELHELLPPIPPETDLTVVFAGDTLDQAESVITELRRDGLNVAVDISDRKLDRQIKSAVKSGVHYILIIGDDELRDQQFTLRNLVTGVEEKHSIERIVSMVRDYRKNKINARN
jgi:histidyl-tRNA synthetase